MNLAIQPAERSEGFDLLIQLLARRVAVSLQADAGQVAADEKSPHNPSDPASQPIDQH